MPCLVALAGFSGAGKTTAIRYLEDLGFGQRLYLGAAVLEEISARGLSRTPENELQIRLELRDREGPAVFAVRATPMIKSVLDADTNVFVDAIFHLEEYQHLHAQFSRYRLILLAIDAAFEVRSQRVQARSGRPLTSEELRDRDGAELARLRTNEVISNAHYRIRNEQSLSTFHRSLDNFWNNVAS